MISHTNWQWSCKASATVGYPYISYLPRQGFVTFADGQVNSVLLVELVVDSDDQNGHGCVTYLSTEGTLMANNVSLPYSTPQYIK